MYTATKVTFITENIFRFNVTKRLYTSDLTWLLEELTFLLELGVYFYYRQRGIIMEKCALVHSVVTYTE